MRITSFLLILLCGTIPVFSQQAAQVQPEAFKKLLDSLPAVQLVDVRTPEEFNTGYLAGAMNINAYDADFLQQLQVLDKHKPVLVYCKAGGRSAQTAAALMKLGFEHVYDLAGGILRWESSNLPVVPGYHEKANAFTRGDFDKLLHENPRVLVDFYAPWCAPCKKMEPALEAIAKKYAGQLLVYRLNIDEAKALARELNVASIPILITYRKGKPVKKVEGYQTSQQLHKLAKQLAQLP